MRRSRSVDAVGREHAAGSTDAFVSLRSMGTFVKLKPLPKFFAEQMALLVGQNTVAQISVSTMSVHAVRCVLALSISVPHLMGQSFSAGLGVAHDICSVLTTAHVPPDIEIERLPHALRRRLVII
jgi:hypothetical protein